MLWARFALLFLFSVTGTNSSVILLVEIGSDYVHLPMEDLRDQIENVSGVTVLAEYQLNNFVEFRVNDSLDNRNEVRSDLLLLVGV